MNAPELRVRMLDQLYAGIDLLADLAAERTGRPPDDFAIRAWAGAVVGVVMATYEEAAEIPSPTTWPPSTKPSPTSPPASRWGPADRQEVRVLR